MFCERDLGFRDIDILIMYISVRVVSTPVSAESNHLCSGPPLETSHQILHAETLKPRRNQRAERHGSAREYK